MAAIPFPPLELANRVGSLADAGDPWSYYDHIGANTKRDIVAALGEDWSFTGKRVLDFGCGAGRTLRHLLEEARVAEICGCDIDAESVAWLEATLCPPLSVFTNGEEPPLDLPDGRFDLVYAVSVFTHLTDSWSRWLLELHRLLVPGGLLLTTYMGRSICEAIIGEPWVDDGYGMNVLRQGEPWSAGGPMVFHDPWWIRAHWGRAFEIVSLTEGGFGSDDAMGQGTVVLRRREVTLTPADLEALEPGEPREATALAHNVRQLLAETTDLRRLRDDLGARLAAAEARTADPGAGGAAIEDSTGLGPTADAPDLERAEPSRPGGEPPPAVVPARSGFRGPWRQVQALRERLAGMAAVIGQTRDCVYSLRETLDTHRAELERQAGSLEAVAESLRSAASRTKVRDEHLDRILRVLLNDERALRERLWSERSTPGYDLAYSDPEPLVSVIIPTYENFKLLGERAIPSILAQTYQNFEVLIVGDRAPAETAATVASFGDDRLRYHNLNRRGPYPSDPVAFWHVAGMPPYNEAVRRARGRWLAPLGDDDAFRPRHIEVLLELARRDRHEATYGKLLTHYREDRPAEEVGVFPPAYCHFGVQALLYHAHLRFFEMELADELFSLPGDWSLAERMLRCGVRFGMVEEIVTDYYPSASWTPRGGPG